MTLLKQIGVNSWEMLLSASGFILLGLVVAGFIHMLLPGSLVGRWLGRRGLSGTALAALIGVPLPICSCGVVPLAMELRKKGASRESTLAFLITTPESSLDSILLTWGLMGPFMAIVRPVAAFVTAILAGIMVIADRNGEGAERLEANEGDPICCKPTETADTSQLRETDHAEQTLGEMAKWWRWLLRQLGIRTSSENEVEEARRPMFGLLIGPALRYGATELLDRVVFWLVIGILLAGVIGALVPADLAEGSLGSGVIPMLLLIVAGVPLYLCASASTPVAAALLLKGFSPGAALVFLLTGPATNISTLLMLAKVFGRRFVAVYLASIVVAALGCGLALDAFVGWVGWTVSAAIGDQSHPASMALQLVFTAALVVLATWRLAAGAFASGMRDLKESMASGLEILGRPPDSESARTWRKRALLVLTTFAALMYLASGLTNVPPEARGYGFVLGRLVAEDLEPGLHWVPPAPFGRMDVQPVETVRKIDVGFRSDPELIARRRLLTLTASPQDWHSPVSAMNIVPDEASYLTGDENLVNLSLSVHYRLEDPSAFLYDLHQPDRLVHLFAQAAAREEIAVLELDALLTRARHELQQGIAQRLQRRLTELGVGVHVISVHVVDVHPPSEAVFAFRDVSSAREDRSTRIHRAREQAAFSLPQARGDAARLRADAQGEVDRIVFGAEGRSRSFSVKAEVYRRGREILRHLLWVEGLERALAGKKKLILPPDTDSGGLSLWQAAPPDQTSTKRE